LLNALEIALALTAVFPPAPVLPPPGPGSRPPSAEKPNPERVARLIVQLGSSRFTEREAATQELAALGPAVIADLRRAIAAESPEIRRRAEKLLQQAERRLLSDQLLEPRPICLVYRDTLVTEAVADLVRRTGLAVKLDEHGMPPAERRVTLDTGETTLWRGLAEFCRAAGLTDRGFEAGFSDDRNTYTWGQRKLVSFDRTTWGSAPRAPGPLVLATGEPRDWPTCYAGAVRIRALPPGTPAGPIAKAEKEKLVLLEVIPEPPLQLQSVLAVRVDRLSNAQGSTLKQRLVVAGLGDTIGNAAEETLVIGDGSTRLPANPFGDAHHICLRLPPAETSLPRLEVLSGTIAAQVRTPPEILLALDDLQPAVGRTFPCADGSSLQVIEAKLTDEGQYRLRVEVTAATPVLVSRGVPARVVVLSRGWWGRSGTEIPPESAGFILLDANGRRLSPANGEVHWLLDRGIRHEFTLLYDLAPNQPPPTRLLYTGRRTATVEVPFTLRDVPLP
jgi:hypothetical protein